MHVVELEVAPEHADALAAEYAKSFRPAIASQPGFRSVTVLRPLGGTRWLLLIDFIAEEERQAWVRTPLHDQVWSKVAAACQSFSGSDFEVVA